VKQGPAARPASVYKLFGVYDSFLKIAVDALANLSIIRPTSGAVETENSLENKELTEVSGEVVFRSSGSEAVKKVVDSGLKRCRIRLPLTSDRSESSV
jgi:hypothetical protein